MIDGPEPRKPVDILLAEDDDGHADLIQENLRECGIINRVRRVSDGQEALDFVRNEGAYRDEEMVNPLLILMDINMPRLDGIEVLAELKRDPRFKHIPVIMLTTTDNPHEVERCYELGCSTYITKPVAFSSFAHCIRQLGLFTEIITLPPIERSASH